jgi:hypothetical protein
MKLRWVPKAKHRADPGEVLREAMGDAAQGLNELALRKHLWFHKHAIAIQPSLVKY